MGLRHGWVRGINNIPTEHNDAISFRELMPDKTRKQQRQQNKISRCWVPNTESNSKVKKIEGVALVEKHIAEGNKEEANRALGKLIFEKQIKPQLDIVAAGVEMDLIQFVAEDIW